MKNKLLLLFGVILFSLLSCGSYEDEYIAINKFPKYSWVAAADSSSTQFVATYWNTTHHCFNNTLDGTVTWNDYWPEAHGLDVLVDAYLRTNDNKYKQAIYDFYNGVKKKNWYKVGGQDTWKNQYYDDMAWHGLAHMRALEATDDARYEQSARELWQWITEGWTDYDGGGIQWRIGSDAESISKGLPSNGPAAIIAARRAQKYPTETVNGFTDLEWAKRIYDWMKFNRVVLSTGRVYESIEDTHGDYSYDSGTFIGAALELYTITKEKMYLNDAIKVANYHISNNINKNYRVLTDWGEQSGNGSGHDCNLFKGIFIRYFTILIQHPDLSNAERTRFIAFLKNNAEYLWTNATIKTSANIVFSYSWWEMPSNGGDLRSAISGATTIETMALLEKGGFIK